ncbi:hypothetical protein GFS31_07260 [Leptolyngbya sp. BL0902]|uniref:hypothetical protein n=1 Tax=Leptolyngbya sp. BL0902 TaxID=1115757 RepID=UPI0018E80956|nr:hypothetical protein [Leptolyngbya sp. BL0902]QQE64054.1 hypothetical protein GFS31_07260 [Leptolyngbya sp. BL0902]
MRKNPAAVTFALLINYSFELGGTNLVDLIYSWLNLYPGKWVITATVEAIYQGRYKVNSVSRILEFWSLKGYPVHHFDYDFADVVCKKLIELDVSETTLSTFQGALTMDSTTTKSASTYPVAKPSLVNSAAAQANSKPKHHAVAINNANTNIDQCERLVVHLSA